MPGEAGSTAPYLEGDEARVGKEYGRPFGGVIVRVIGTTFDGNYEGGIGVAIRNDATGHTATLSVNWLTFVSRPTLPDGAIDWDDDIPFSSSTYRSTHNGECIDFDKHNSEEVYFG